MRYYFAFRVKVASLYAFLNERKRDVLFWLDIGIFLYIILLPFNAFGFKVPILGYLVKYTQLALAFVIIVAAWAYTKGTLKIRKARWLYFFLLLQAITQFVSLLNAQNVFSGFDVAMAVAQYSILVFVLINGMRTEKILRTVLVIMGTITAGISVVAYLQSFITRMRGIDYHPTMSSEALLGLGVPHYLAYLLIMYGAGLAYLFVRRTDNRYLRWLITLAVLIWLEVLLITSVKVAHIVALFFSILLIVTLYGARKRAFALLLACIILFAVRFYVIPIKNTAFAIRHKTTATLVAWQDGVAQALRKSPEEKPAGSTGVSVAAVVTANSSPSPVESGSPVSQSPPSPSPSPAPAPVSPPPPSPPSPSTPPVVNEYSGENRVRRRWSGTQLSDSKKIRQQGIAVGWLMGAESPWTGVGAGQTGLVFDAFIEKAHTKARELPDSSFQRHIFTDETLQMNFADKGLFNIFMNAWAETGIFGLLAVLGILATVFFKSVVTLWRIRKIPGVYPIRILFPLFLALILYHQTIYLWVHPWLWTIIALTYAAADIKYDTNQQMKGESTNMRIRKFVD